MEHCRYAMGMNIPLHPPASWFEYPGEGAIPTDRRMTIEVDEAGDPTGRVYGFIALYDTCHAGAPGCVTPPRKSPSSFEYAHQGQTQTAEGTLVSTANIGGSGHANLKASPEAAAAHYQEHISTQMMRVRYGTDDKGIWFSGALWPDVSELDVAHILASPISGDWRWMNSWRETDAGYDFAGACLVSLPGFAMANAGQVAQEEGAMQTLAASASSVGMSDGGDILAMYARPEVNHAKESPEMCQSACSCGETAAPLPVTPCTCGVKTMCDCGGANTPVTASTTEATPVASEETKLIIDKLNEFGERISAIEDKGRREEAEALLSEIEAEVEASGIASE